MALQFVDIAGRWEFPIPGMTGYSHFNDIILYPALPGTRTERVNQLMHSVGQSKPCAVEISLESK
jgi:hypothetical protein